MNTYKTLMFARFCASSAEHLDLGLSKEQQVCLSNECSEMMVYVRIILKQSFNNIMFVRFCIASVRHVDIGLNTEQQICLFKECIEMAKYYDEMNVMKYSILVLALLNKSMSTYQQLQMYEDAIFYGKQCIDIAKEIGDKKTEMDAYFVLARTHAILEQYENAIINGMKCIDIAKATGDKQTEMCGYLLLVTSYGALEQYDDAILHGKKCIDIANEIGDKQVEMNAYFVLASAYVVLEQYDDAILHGKKCIDIANEIGNKQAEMNAYLVLARAYVVLEQYDDAILHGKKCVGIANEIGDKQVEMNAYFVLARAYVVLKQHDDAILHGKKCIDIANEIGDKQVEMKTYFVLAREYVVLEQYDDVILPCKKCIDIANEIGDKQVKMNAYLVLARAYVLLEQYDDAILHGKKCVDIANEIGDKQIEMEAHLLLVESFQIMGQLDSTYLHLDEGMIIAKELKDYNVEKKFDAHLRMFHIWVGTNETASVRSVEESVPPSSKEDLVDVLDKSIKANDVVGQKAALYSLFSFYDSEGQYDKAIECSKQILQLEMFNAQDKLLLNVWIAAFYRKTNQHDEALKYGEEVLPEVKEHTNSVTRAKFYSLMGYLHFLKSQLNSAEEYLREGIRCFETTFASLGSHDDFKISIVDQYVNSYKYLSLVLILTDRSKEALLVSDRCRARGLRDLLRFGMKQEASIEEHMQYVHSDIEAIFSNNKFSILFYTVYDNDNDILSYLIDSKLVLFHQYKKGGKEFVDTAFDEIDVRHVVNCENRSLDTEQDIENSQKQNDTKEESLFFACTNSVIENNLSQQRMTDLVSRGETSEDMDKGSNWSAIEGLYDSLIGSFKDLVKEEEIVIIPEGPLCKVPFAALRDPVTGQYLSETKRIRLAPSIATLKFLQELPADHYCKAGALIIGDPLVGTVMLNGEERSDIPPLESANAEARVVAYRLGVTPLIGKDATKPAVIEKLRQGVSVVHIAAHGILSKATIVLAPSPETRATKIPDEEDYMLTMADVQKAQVRAQLVVLSCCHSGRGETRAEGVVGMCRAFLASGARAVVASLWAIDDDATLDFMSLFYFYLKTGKSASTSLQLTMNEMRKTKNFSEPKYWAPFFLMGDDVTINNV